jgi:hypothetical protein
MIDVEGTDKSNLHNSHGSNVSFLHPVTCASCASILLLSMHVWHNSTLIRSRPLPMYATVPASFAFCCALDIGDLKKLPPARFEADLFLKMHPTTHTATVTAETIKTKVRLLYGDVSGQDSDVACVPALTEKDTSESRICEHNQV